VWLPYPENDKTFRANVRIGENGQREFGVWEEEVWPEAQARADAIVTAFDAWSAGLDAVAEASGFNAAQAKDHELSKANQALRRKIVTTPAVTMQGLLLKVTVAAWCWHGTKGLVEDLREHDSGCEALAAAVVLDLARMIGIPEVMRGGESVAADADAPILHAAE